MDYYKMRSTIMQKISNHLEQREEFLQKKLSPPPFIDFSRRLKIEFGVTDKMIRNMVEDLVPGATVRDDDIVKV